MKRKNAGCAVAILAVLGLGYWFYDTMMLSYGPYGTVTRTACLSNLNGMGKAIQLYAEDHDGRLMPAPIWLDAIERDLPSKEVAHCPCLIRADKKGPDIYGYAFNLLLSERRIKDFEDPDLTFLLFESKKTERNAADPVLSFSGPYDPDKPETGRANVLFLNGNARRVGKRLAR